MELNNTIAKRLGRHLRIACEKLGETREKCARKLGLNERYIEDIEEGRLTSISRAILERIMLNYILKTSAANDRAQIIESKYSKDNISELLDDEFWDVLNTWLLPLTPCQNGQIELNTNNMNDDSRLLTYNEAAVLTPKESPNDRLKFICPRHPNKPSEDECNRCHIRFQCYFYNAI